MYSIMDALDRGDFGALSHSELAFWTDGRYRLPSHRGGAHCSRTELGRVSRCLRTEATWPKCSRLFTSVGRNPKIVLSIAIKRFSLNRFWLKKCMRCVIASTRGRVKISCTRKYMPNLTKAYVDTFLKGAASTTI